MLHVPTDPGRQRTVLIVLVHGREVTPLGIVACDLDHSRLEIDAKPFPQQEKPAGARRRMESPQPRSQSWRSEEDREEAGFEQHSVGLVTGKVLGGAHEGKK